MLKPIVDRGYSRNDVENGNRMPYTSKWKFSGGANYEHDIGDAGKLALDLNASSDAAPGATTRASTSTATCRCPPPTRW